MSGRLNCPVLVCGDFNTTPQNDLYSLITQGRLPAPGPSSSMLPALQSAYADFLGHEPPFTNFKPSFKATLDYIFYNRAQSVVRAVQELPARHEIELEIGLPSSLHGSDHLPIGAVMECIFS